MSSSLTVQEVLARKIAGEIILSSGPGAAMRKWRELFAISQNRLSEKMILSPSVISDYESGRRRSPGTRFVRRFVWALLTIDREGGGSFIRKRGISLLKDDYRIVRDYAKALRMEREVLAKLIPAPTKVGT